ncbi:C40 family peptidase [Paenibacillus tianjinensis]|uniref:C40 family peptidase n=1 Tax=Paenibacillus tianjinensis TaxID=2810347 RepID=A0ABX7LJ44_9BACL|nr:C40 family peptidase [Paenibacillus tianjinensis]
MNTTHSKRRFRNFTIGVSLGAALLAAGTGITGNSSTAYAATSTTPANSVSSSIADKIIATGLKYQGVRYEYGAESGITSSFDCSSFTQFVFEHNEISLPRSSKQQSTVGTYVSRNELQPGDLVFFYSPVHHVAIYMGDGKILHTYGDDGVTITPLNTGWWASHYTSARRVLPTNGQAASDSGSASASPDPATPASSDVSSQEQTIGDAWDWLNNFE